MNVNKIDITIDNKTIEVESGKFAYQANASVTVKLGDTIILVTVVAEDKPKEDVDFFPLTCDFEEKLYAAGKIPGGFIKREGRPSEKAILTSRLIDRPLRPLFPKGFRNEVQIVATPLSVDIQIPPDILAVLAASFSLMISDIPWNGPVGVVRICSKNNEFIILPYADEIQESDLEIVLAATEQKIIMLETRAKEVDEDIIISAINFAKPYISDLCSVQRKFRDIAGKPKMDFIPYLPDEEVLKEVRKKTQDEIYHIFHQKYSKKEREAKLQKLFISLQEELKEIFPNKEREIQQAFESVEKDVLRNMIVSEKIRVDGRKFNEIRNIYCEVGLLPRTHGSALFTRGETQVLTTATLGTVGDEQIIDGLSEETTKRFMHQYNFPPFSVGEIRPIRGPGRRDIGHGALAEKSLEVVIPSQKDFPYTIRLVSEVLSSNGSTSMASVCASTLALMDAGIPILSPVAGISTGLVIEGENINILSDIQGIEDAFGDMDFKVAGTKQGITSIQLDIKSDGLTLSVLKDALLQAKEGRLKILDEMLKTLPEYRKNLSCFAPRIFTLEVPSDKVGEIIGPGGKNIKKIIEETGVKIDIQENKFVYITAPDENSGRAALSIISAQIKEIEVGEIYFGKVTRIAPFGAFVEIAPNKEGLLHISNIENRRINRVEDVLKIGDRIKVKVIEIDDIGRINLSRKALL